MKKPTLKQVLIALNGEIGYKIAKMAIKTTNGSFTNHEVLARIMRQTKNYAKALADGIDNGNLTANELTYWSVLMSQLNDIEKGLNKKLIKK